jgi:hypothetical protein
MSALAKECRGKMLAKAKRLGGEKDQKTDSSNWTPAKPLNTEYKTGLQPLGERMARKSGGRVEGEKAVVDAYVNRDVKAANAKAEGKPHEGGYKAGGRTGKKDGGGNWIKGAIKKPGALHKSLGVKEGEKIPEKKLEKAEHSKNKLTAKRARLAETLKGMAKKDGGKVAKAAGGRTESHTADEWAKIRKAQREEGVSGRGTSETLIGASPTTGKMTVGGGSSGRGIPGDKTDEMKKGGRVARASGGRTKGKTNISINILAGGKPGVPGADTATMPVAPPPPMTPPPMVPPPAAPPPASVVPPQMMQGSPMPMGRKAGGRVYRSYKDMDAGACSGDGRLEKTEIQKNKRA